jgi:lipopolysaccharide transport system ATP-binding protein
LSDIAIKVENLSKLYRLGSIGTGSIASDLTRWWANVRGKEDPFAKIAVNNDRSQKSDSEYVWSLKDIDFEIKKGDAVGIIGRNGAGKSTLLKILSRVTTPTTGSVKINGRVASLLEVGTGFNPELTGRENIYMNGAILGMSRREITSKMEEIVEFSGVAGYIDTPVKRYSSGMYVRLAFAVAAHLEPDILIIDEVLAVGDAEFQKKCLGKMQDVNNKEGRTVLFVSHNMAAVQKLCNKGIVLHNGVLSYQGSNNQALKQYLQSSQTVENQTGQIQWEDENAPGDNVKLISIRLLDENDVPNNLFYLDRPIFVEITYKCIEEFSNIRLAVQLLDEYESVVFTTTDEGSAEEKRKKGKHVSTVTIPANLLNKNRYFVFIHIGQPGVQVLLQGKTYLYFDTDFSSTNSILLTEQLPGFVAPKLTWKHK